MPYGWTGTTLEVNLTQQSIRKVKTDPELVRSFLGGKGLGAKIFWDRVSPETQPFSPDNLIIITPGLLVGTPAPFANRTVFTFISPVTELYRYAAMGGYWANELKHAGYDNIIISGKSAIPVYLWIKDDKVELRDASHLWGKGTFATRNSLRQQLKNKDIQVACIGQAGENKIYSSSVQGGTGASATRGGLGALWGDKKLKAIAVSGTKDVNVAHPASLIETSNYIMARAEKLAEQRNNMAFRPSPGTNLEGMKVTRKLPTWYGNYNDPTDNNLGVIPEEDALDSALKKKADKIDTKVEAWKSVNSKACHNCRVHCRGAFSRSDRETIFLKCTAPQSFFVATNYFDYNWALDCYYKCEDWGLDIHSLPRSIALAIDLYQKGILTQKDTDGMHLEFGNPEVFNILMEKTVRREGIGDILANGTFRAAHQIGRGAEEYITLRQGLDLTILASQHYLPYMALGLAISDKQFTGGQIAAEPWAKMHVGKYKEEKEAYIKEGWFAYPEGYEKYWLSDPGYEGTDYEASCQLLSYDQERFALTESLGLCHFTTGFGSRFPITTRAQLASMVSDATGFDVGEDELTTIANRIVSLVRAYNLRRGLRRKDDTLPKIFFEEEVFPPQKKVDRILFNKWLDRFYELRGWNEEGVPTKETLEKYGLDYVYRDLEQREILKKKRALLTIT